MSLSLVVNPPLAKTRMTFRPGPQVCGHTTEYSDIHRVACIDGLLVSFTEVEYQVFLLLIENYAHDQQRHEVSYHDIAQKVFGCLTRIYCQ